MCVSCDCGEHAEGHGNPSHITLEMVEAAAKAAGISVDQVAHNILDAVHSHDH